MSDKKQKGKPLQKPEKTKRLSKSLKENLLRRKEQIKSRVQNTLEQGE